MNHKNTADQAFVRETNLSLVLRLIHTQPPISRAQLAHVTGLNKSTVSSLVDDLLERNLIHETGINSVGAGRPATLLEVIRRQATLSVLSLALILSQWR